MHSVITDGQTARVVDDEEAQARQRWEDYIAHNTKELEAFADVVSAFYFRLLEKLPVELAATLTAKYVEAAVARSNEDNRRHYR